VYPVEANHSTVLGYGATSKAGKPMWAALVWAGARKDGGAHMMNPTGGEYLHVRVKPLTDGCWYRVRCSHSRGNRWRGGVVENVEVKQKRGKWHWHVTVSSNVEVSGQSGRDKASACKPDSMRPL
jgi:hypothetical protein